MSGRHRATVRDKKRRRCCKAARRKAPPKASRSFFRTATGPTRRFTISAPISPTTASRAAAFWRSATSSASPTVSSRARPICLHGGGFNKVRNFLLDRSATILQDDSGIPLAYFDPKKWRLQPFGRYVGPILDFPDALIRPRMGELFRKGNADPDRFRASAIGGERTNRTCCSPQRIAPRTGEAELAPP